MFWIDGVGGGSCTHEKGPEVGDWTREKHTRSCQKWKNKLFEDFLLSCTLFWDQSWRNSVYLLDSQRKTSLPRFWDSPPPWSLCLECWLQWVSYQWRCHQLFHCQNIFVFVKKSALHSLCIQGSLNLPLLLISFTQPSVTICIWVISLISWSLQSKSTNSFQNSCKYENNIVDFLTTL